jgi:hypothetical protein
MEIELVERPKPESAKLPYESPELKLYGSLVELTMTGPGVSGDG